MRVFTNHICKMLSRCPILLKIANIHVSVLDSKCPHSSCPTWNHSATMESEAASARFRAPQSIRAPENIGVWVPGRSQDGSRAQSAHITTSCWNLKPVFARLCAGWSLRHCQDTHNCDRWSFLPGPVVVTWLGSKVIESRLKKCLKRTF